MNDEGIKYINLFEFWRSCLKKNSLKIYTPSKTRIKEETYNELNNWSVIINNEITTGNFRMIDSYLPEIIALLSYNILDQQESNLQSSLIEFCKGFTLYDSPTFTKKVIDHRFICLIETVLFSNFFSEVWSGELINNRCFVTKENNELNYFTLSHGKIVSKKIFELLTIKSEWISSSTDKEKTILKLKFGLNHK